MTQVSHIMIYENSYIDMNLTPLLVTLTIKLMEQISECILNKGG